MTAKFVAYPSRDALFSTLALQVGAELETALQVKDRVTLAVPGGTTPAPFFKQLRSKILEWNRVNVILGDERFVPENSDRSNTRLIREHLLQENAAAATLLPMYLPGDRPEDVLLEIASGIAPNLPIDVCVVGMGADMHTASIFPEADMLEAALDPNAPIVLPMRAPGAPEPRLTLNARILQDARNIHVLITGVAKKEAYHVALQDGPTIDAPIRAVLQAPITPTVHYAD